LKPHGHFSASPEERGRENGYLNPHEIYKFTNHKLTKFENNAYFTKRGLNKRTVLHEFYHHLVEMKGLELPERIEEKQANGFASEFVKKP
jgi:hypothetical protein